MTLFILFTNIEQTVVNSLHGLLDCEMNRTEQIFYFRTYTKYIVTIQYIYICHVWYNATQRNGWIRLSCYYNRV